MRSSIDKALTLVALVALVTLGLATGAPLLEPFGQGRLTYLTLWGVPVLLFVLLLRRKPGLFSRFLKDWWPIVGTLAVYESLKHMHANRITLWLGIEPQDELMLRIDELLFFGKTLPLWMDSWTAPWFFETMRFHYIWVYYAGPVVLLGWAYLFAQDRTLFRRLRVGLVLGLLGGYVLYLLVPVAGPKFLIGDQFQHSIPGHHRLDTLVFDTLRFQWDCFPSLHTAIPWLLTVLAWRRVSLLVRVLCCVLSCGVTLSTVALRLHYGIDLIAAFAWVGVVLVVVEKLRRSDYGTFTLPLPANTARHLERPGPLRRRLRLGAALQFAVGATATTVALVWERVAHTLLGGGALGGALILGASLAGLALGLYGRSALEGRIAGLRGLRLSATAHAGAAGWLALSAMALPHAAAVAAWLPAGDGSRLGPGLFLTFLVLPVGAWLGISWPEPYAMARRRVGPGAIRSLVSGCLFGAGLACLAGPGAILSTMGLDRTLLAAAAVSLLLCLVFYRLPLVALERLRPPAPAAPRDRGALTHSWSERMLSALTGLASWALASLIVLWLHLFPIIFGEATLAFSFVLAAVLLGLAGARLVQRVLPFRESRGALLRGGMLLVATGLALAALNGRWPSTPQILASQVQDASSLTGAKLLLFRHTLLLTLAPVGILGLVSLRPERPVIPPSRPGHNLFTLLLAAAVLALVTAPFLIGSLGAALSLFLLASVLSAFGLAVVAMAASKRLAWTLPVGTLVLIVLLLVPIAWDPLDLLFRAVQDSGLRTGSATVLSLDERARGGWTAVIEGEAEGAGVGRVRGMAIDGIWITDNTSMEAETATILIPFLHTRDLGQALLLRAPTGWSAHVLGQLGFSRLELVEGSRGVLEATRSWFSETDSAGLDTEVELVVDPPRLALERSRRRYDLIACQVTSFWHSRSEGLHSVEFFRGVQNHLAPGGVFQQSIPLADLQPVELAIILNSARAVFPHVSLWAAGRFAVLLAADTELRLQPEAARRLEAAAPNLGWGSGSFDGSLDSLLSSRLLSPPEVSDLTAKGGFALETDANRALELNARHLAILGLDLTAANLLAFTRSAGYGPLEVAGEMPTAVSQSLGRADARRHFAARLESLRALAAVPRSSSP